MLSSHLTRATTQIKPFEAKVFSDDIFKKPRGQALLMAVFQAEIGKNHLFNQIDQLSNKKLTQKAKEISFKGERGEFLILSPSGFPYEEIIVFGLGKKQLFSLSLLARCFAEAVRCLTSRKIKSAAFLAEDGFNSSFFELGKFLSEAFYLSQYQFDRYKSPEEREKTKRVEKMFFFIQNSGQNVDEFKKGVEFAKIVSEGIYLVRNLVNEPASHLHPKVLVNVAEAIAKKSLGRMTVQTFNQGQCQKLGMGAFLGVAQGSDHEPYFIILKYEPKDVKRPAKKTVCLIGKSITFDSGGLSLKPAEAMETMKIDMAGGATVLGLFQTIADLEKKQLIRLPFNLYGLLPACENMPSGQALRPGDVVTSLNGRTIEVVNTDAEGRLALADALSYAEKYLQPDYIVDLATLTGAVVVALGEAIAGLFGNHQDLTDKLMQSAREEGEAIWPMPLYQDYLEKMKSDIADLKNVSGSRYGGAITAALFLQEFVSAKTRWVHLDIAGASYNSDKPQGLIVKGATGWGVKTLIRFITKTLT